MIPPLDEARAQLRTLLRARRQALAPVVRMAAAEAVAERLRMRAELSSARHVGGYWAVRGELPLHALLSPALGACRTWSAESENRPQRGQFLPGLQPNSPAIGQKDGEKWTAAVDLQPAISKSDRLPGFVYCLPCLAPGGRLRFAPWQPGGSLIQNRYGIPEPDPASGSRLAPDELDVVLVPLVGFDRHGARLGAGGGYYDRSFAFLQQQQRPGRPLLIGIGYDMQEIDALPHQPWDVPMDLVVTPTRTLVFGAGARES